MNGRIGDWGALKANVVRVRREELAAPRELDLVVIGPSAETMSKVHAISGDGGDGSVRETKRQSLGGIWYIQKQTQKVEGPNLLATVGKNTRDQAVVLRPLRMEIIENENTRNFPL